MEKAWLTDELDNTPYVYDKEDVEKCVKDLNLPEKYDKLRNFFENNPAAKRKVFSDEYRKNKFYLSALSFLEIDTELEKTETIDTSNLTEEQALRLSAYYDACKMAHDMSVRANFFIDQDLMVRVHRVLSSGERDKNLLMRYRLRDETDPSIMVGQGYFQPVPGKDVGLRTGLLLWNLYSNWADDNIFVKGAKFVTEYVRIQPHMDGNKRMALILLNCLFESQPNGSIPAIYFNKNQIGQLYEHIKQSMLTRDVTDFANYLAKQVSKRYDETIDRAEAYEIKKSIEAVNKDFDKDGK